MFSFFPGEFIIASFDSQSEFWPFCPIFHSSRRVTRICVSNYIYTPIQTFASVKLYRQFALHAAVIFQNKK